MDDLVQSWGARSDPRHRRERGNWLTCNDDFGLRSDDAVNYREGTGGVVGSHMFQHVGCRLNRPLTNLVHADFVPAVFTRHGNAASDASDPDVHALTLRPIAGGCRGHWDSDLSLIPTVRPDADYAEW